MREDMFKVIVERPRPRKDGDALAGRLRGGVDGPMRLGMRAGYGYRNLNENLTPLRRYLRAQAGRPWSKVFSEICAGIDRRNMVQQHIHQHIRDFIATDIEVRDGRLVDLFRPTSWSGGDGLLTELYVDPKSGLIRLNKAYGGWRRYAAERRESEQAAIDARRRVVDDLALLLRIDDLWFRVAVAELPEKCTAEKIVDGQRRRYTTAEPRFDAVLRENCSRVLDVNLERRKYLYGCADLYAVSKRQMSKRELMSHGLR